MADPSIAAATAWWGSPSVPDLIAREIVGPGAIADLVGVQFDQAALRAREEAEIQPLIDALALRTVLGCRRQARSIAELAEALRVSSSGARRAAKLAWESEALVEVSKGRFKAHPAWKPAARRLIAVELKLRNWRRAFDQTRYYQRWANAAWIVLATPPPASAREAAKDAGVGLGFLNGGQGLEVVSRPAPRPNLGIKDWATSWAGEQTVAALV